RAPGRRLRGVLEPVHVLPDGTPEVPARRHGRAAAGRSPAPRAAPHHGLRGHAVRQVRRGPPEPRPMELSRRAASGGGRRPAPRGGRGPDCPRGPDRPLPPANVPSRDGAGSVTGTAASAAPPDVRRRGVALL